MIFPKLFDTVLHSPGEEEGKEAAKKTEEAIAMVWCPFKTDINVQFLRV